MAKVTLSVEATASLRSHLSYLGARNATAAARLSADVARCTDLLAEHPGSGRRIAGTPLRVGITRRYRYRLYYVERSGGVEIIDILHPRQSGPF